MKTNNKIYTLIIILIVAINSSSFSQDECYDFKKGRGSSKGRNGHLKFNPIKSLKKSDGIIKLKSAFYTSLQTSTREENYLVNSNGDTTLTSFHSEGKYTAAATGKQWAGYDLLLTYEKKINNKSALEFSVGYEYVSKSSHADTFNFYYPTVDMGQYMNEKNDILTIDPYDENEFNNFQIGAAYRFYFTEAYRGFYVSPKVSATIGRGKYYDLDKNNLNVNYSYKQYNWAVGSSLLAGYQFNIKKHLIVDLYAGATFKAGNSFARTYQSSLANDQGLFTKYPNTSALNERYGTTLTVGLGIGYRFKASSNKN